MVHKYVFSGMTCKHNCLSCFFHSGKWAFCSFFSCAYNILLHFPLFFCFLPSLNQSFSGQTGLSSPPPPPPPCHIPIIQLLSFSPTKNVRISVGTEPNSAGVSPFRPPNQWWFCPCFYLPPFGSPSKTATNDWGERRHLLNTWEQKRFSQKNAGTNTFLRKMLH